MMNEATKQFVRQHANDNVRLLALRDSKDSEVDLSLALQQIQGRQTARRKLPSWAKLDDIVYPPHLNMEQCSSEQTARYKAALCQRLGTGGQMADLTGGFGVDFAFMAPIFERATYVEQNEQLFAISSANLAKILSSVSSSVNFVNCDGTAFFRTLSHVSLFFLDPARRDLHGARTYGIADCTPDVLALRDELLNRADYVLLKLSPMLDWRKAVNDLGPDNVSEVHIVATGGECKELLVLLASKTDSPTLTLHCVNDDERMVVTLQKATLTTEHAILAMAREGEPETRQYLYEPHAAIMKGGCFAELTERFGIRMIAPNSHLFVSDKQQSNFPGRVFRIADVATMNKRELRQKLGTVSQANISVRNFPLTVAELRKRLRLSDGGSAYIFATTLADSRHVLLLCEKK